MPGRTKSLATDREPATDAARCGRNDPCFCGSGRKYKKCCDGKARSTAQPDVARLFEEAHREHQRGHVERALRLYREVLAADPRHADALHRLGARLIDEGQPESGVEMIRRAIGFHADSFAYHCDLGTGLHHLGRLEDAAAAYEEALRLQPGSALALGNLGGVLLSLKRLPEALACLEKSVALDPSQAIAHTNLGLVLHTMGKSRDAMYYSRKAVELAPDSLDTVSNYAKLLLELQRWSEAVLYCERWVLLQPENARVHQGLGDCHVYLGRKHEAARHYWKALQLQPDFQEAASNLGTCLVEGGLDEEAMVLFRKVLETNPNYPVVWTNMGEALRNLCQPEAGLECHEKALALDPGNRLARWNRSLSLLDLGRLAEGWADYGWRVATGKSRMRPFPQPAWDGRDPAGKTILVWMEQGLGDEILFASLLSDLSRAGAHLVVECDERLAKLLERSFPGTEAVPKTDPPHPRTQQADIDAQIAGGALPRLFRPNLESFPQGPGFLVPDPQLACRWKVRLEALGEGLKVGICWRSRRNKEAMARHSTDLNQWGPILTVPGIHFVNLQYDQCGDELRAAEQRFGARIHGWEELDLMHDQEGLAALISNLDLVLSTGTAVQDMAGAIGVPTWVLVRHPAEVWGLGTAHCPWLPSVRAFYAQGASDPWDPVIERMAAELAALRFAEVRHAPSDDAGYGGDHAILGRRG